MPHLISTLQLVVGPLLIALATVARVEIYLQHQRRCIFGDSQDLTKGSLNSQDKTKFKRPEKKDSQDKTQYHTRPTRLEKRLTRQDSQGKTQKARHKGQDTTRLTRLATLQKMSQKLLMPSWQEKRITWSIGRVYFKCDFQYSKNDAKGTRDPRAESSHQSNCFSVRLQVDQNSA